MSNAAVIATGAPNPAAPSMNAPKQKAMRITCTRASGAIPANWIRSESNRPDSTVNRWRNITFRTIHPIGNRP